MTTAQTVTAKNAAISFYDIESLENVFTVAFYHRHTGDAEQFYLVDDGEYPLNRAMKHPLPARITPETPGPLAEGIYSQNPGFTGDVELHDLSTMEGRARLAKLVGLSDAKSVNDPDSMSNYSASLRPVCDTDPQYDPINAHPYLAGYNSEKYDTTIMAIALVALFTSETPSVDRDVSSATASYIRRYNDMMFSAEYIGFMPKVLTQAFDGGWNSTPQRVRQAMIDSGRHIDVSNFNEGRKMAPQKRVTGDKGGQIFEAQSSLSGPDTSLKTISGFIDMLAYNLSDVVELSGIFADPIYSGAFDRNKLMLDTFPEMIYDKVSEDDPRPDVDPKKVRFKRLTPDSSSAKLTATMLAPYGALRDWETVSLVYPHPDVAKARGVEPVDVLEECKKFFYSNVEDSEARAAFDNIYKYYGSIRGSNFNDSQRYIDAYGDNGVLPDRLKPRLLDYKEGEPASKVIQRYPNTIAYYRRNGSMSPAYATFSKGGIHGAEMNLELWQKDLENYESAVEQLERVKDLYPDPKDYTAAAKAQHDALPLPDGSFVDKAVVLNGSKPETVKYRKPKKGDDDQNEQLARAQAQVEDPADLLAAQRTGLTHFDLVTDHGLIEGSKVLEKKTLSTPVYKASVTGKRPTLFEPGSAGFTKLNPRYVMTSAGVAIHQDFTSYYPNLLIGMQAFANPELGEDRYYTMFLQKEEFGKLRKQTEDPALKEYYEVRRNGTKLGLNSASGAGDVEYDTTIRMNNVIISMRLLGQLFSWRIGQAETFEGAVMVSTNTDGLYAMWPEHTVDGRITEAGHQLNNRILAEQSAATGVEIEPETMLLVSKDTNNRLEMLLPEDDPEVEDPSAVQMWQSRIVGASGGTVASHKEPRIDKNLAHPAALDFTLVRYLRMIAGGFVPEHRDTALDIHEPMDPEVARELMHSVITENDAVHAVRMFQKMVSASTGTLTFPFAVDPDDEEMSEPTSLQHYNRVFYVKEGTESAVRLRNARSAVISDATSAKRTKDGLPSRVVEPAAAKIMRDNQFAVTSIESSETGYPKLPEDQDVKVSSVPGISATNTMLINNATILHAEPEHLEAMLASIDIEAYVDLVVERFRKTWKVIG